MLNSIKATFNFREKGNPNFSLPKLSEFHKKLENLPQRHFGAKKKNNNNSYFVLRYHHVVL